MCPLLHSHIYIQLDPLPPLSTPLSVIAIVLHLDTCGNAGGPHESVRDSNSRLGSPDTSTDDGSNNQNIIYEY